MRWDEFAEAAPELAALGEERLRGRELCLVGTLRANGWPRISPVEPEFVNGEHMLGMMWRSPKALDLLRDPRLVVHSVVSRRDGDEGDFKLSGFPSANRRQRAGSRRGAMGLRGIRTAACAAGSSASRSVAS